MQSSDLNVLMISYGRGALYENKAGVLDRHIEYANNFKSLVIIYLTKTKLEEKQIGKLKIVPIYSISYLLSTTKAIFFRPINFHVVTSQDPFLTGILGLFYKWIYKIKLHVQNHSNYIDNKFWINESSIQNSLLNLIAKKIVIPNADRLRVVNSFEKSLYINKLKIKNSKIDIAPIALNPVFCKNISEQEIKSFMDKYLIDRNKIKIGWAGRFVRLKRLDYLYELVSSISMEKNCQLILAGDNHNSEYNLQNLESINNIKPIYTGFLTPIELAKFYSSIDVFVLTSDYEGYGMVLKEALHFNCPILVSNEPEGIKEILIDGENGFSFHDKQDFLIKLNRLKDLSSYSSINNTFSENINIINSIAKTYKN
jgi:glycosyltransferase involved in cell wall biosynthesis